MGHCNQVISKVLGMGAIIPGIQDAKMGVCGVGFEGDLRGAGMGASPKAMNGKVSLDQGMGNSGAQTHLARMRRG